MVKEINNINMEKPNKIVSIFQKKIKTQTELNTERKRKRAAVQLLHKNNPKLSTRQISKILSNSVSHVTVAKWIKRTTFEDKVRERKSKITQEIIDFIKKNAANKLSRIDSASGSCMAQKIYKKFGVKFSREYMNKILTKVIGKPRKIKKTFLLRKTDIATRIKFAKYIKDNNLKGRNLFFTDEKRFCLFAKINSQLNQIRLDENGLSEISKGEGKIFEKVHQQFPKFTKSLMVCGGISYQGLSKLIFSIGTIDANSYLKALSYYKNDIERLNSDLILEQDGASPHTSKKSKDYIAENFKALPFWPPNSPDLSPIETVWAILEERVNRVKYKNILELINRINYYWNRFPKRLCRKLIDQFDKKIEIMKDTGLRVNKIPGETNKIKYKALLRKKRWNHSWNKENKIENIIYNTKIINVIKERKIKAIKGYIKELTKEKTKALYPYSIKNRKLVKEELPEGAYKLFISQMNNIKKTFDEQISIQESNIKKIEKMNSEEFFISMNYEEKIKHISSDGKPIKMENIEKIVIENNQENQKSVSDDTKLQEKNITNKSTTCFTK